MINRKDLRVRDPFIVVDNGIYYLYVTTGATTLSYYFSTNLDNWEFGGTAFEIPRDSWATQDVWAAEVHRYNEKFYMFVSLLGKNGLRATQIAKADTPRGPFIPIVNHGITPVGQSCIDGTFYVSDGTPYIIYSHDWPDNYVESSAAYIGEIYAAQLSQDLKSIIGKPWRLFASDESPISKATPHSLEWLGKKTKRYGSDAPFIQKLSDGRLLLTWSPYLNGNYVVLSAISENGDIHGKWEHGNTPIFDKNGGHAMFFHDLQGRLCMCIHSPELPMQERATIFEMQENEIGLKIIKEL